MSKARLLLGVPPFKNTDMRLLTAFAPLPEPALCLNPLPVMPSPTLAQRFVETGLTENVVRDLLTSLKGHLFFQCGAILVTSGKSARVYTPGFSWHLCKTIVQEDQCNGRA